MTWPVVPAVVSHMVVQWSALLRLCNRSWQHGPDELGSFLRKLPVCVDVTFSLPASSSDPTNTQVAVSLAVPLTAYRTAGAEA